MVAALPMVCALVPVNTTVPVLAVNVPAPDQLPVRLSVLDPPFSVPAVSVTLPLTE